MTRTLGTMSLGEVADTAMCMLRASPSIDRDIDIKAQTENVKHLAEVIKTLTVSIASLHELEERGIVIKHSPILRPYDIMVEWRRGYIAVDVDMDVFAGAMESNDLLYVSGSPIRDKISRLLDVNLRNAQFERGFNALSRLGPFQALDGALSLLVEKYGDERAWLVKITKSYQTATDKAAEATRIGAEKKAAKAARIAARKRIVEPVRNMADDDTRPYYYKVLDVSIDASQDAIKKAYRRLSMLFHPDASSDPDAEKKMKEINKAHAVLSDPDKRKRYDNFERVFQ